MAQLYASAQWMNDYSECWFTGTAPLPKSHGPDDVKPSLRLCNVAHGLSQEDGRYWAYDALGLPKGTKQYTIYGPMWHEQFAQGRESVMFMDLADWSGVKCKSAYELIS
jgi:hypothetical protein